jgi:hypothetical protein
MIKTLWLTAILLTQAPAPAPTPVFKVSGTIVREDNRAPDSVPNADRILLRGAGAPKVLDIESSGAFEFTKVSPGSYEIVIGPMITMEPLKVVVTDKDVTGLRVVVPDLVSVRGTVIVEGGGPYPRFQLVFTRIDGAEPRPAPVNIPTTTLFAATLSPGQYRVTANGLPNGYALKSMTMGTTDVLTQPMSLPSGDSQSMTFTLGVASPPPWVNVRGRVIGSSAAAQQPKSVTMSSPSAADTLTAVLQQDGSFEFEKVLPGAYTAHTLPLTSMSADGTLTVGTSDVTNFEVRTPQPKEVRGRIVIEGSVPMPRLAFSVGGAPLPANPQQDGTFTITMPEGERQISVLPTSVPAGYTLASFTYGSTDLQKNPMRVAAADTAQLTVGFNASAVKPVNVSGRVTGLLTTKGVRVVLMNPVLASTEASVNPDGSFHFSGIIPGNYVARLSLSGLTAGTSISVGDRDVSDAVIEYPRQFVVTGHVLVEGGSAANPPQITLEAKPATGRATTADGIGNGVIMFTLKDGEYSVSVRGVPSGYQVKSIVYGTTDLQKEPLKIDGPVTWEIILRLVASR